VTQLELRHLRYFLAVAEELNFSRAAERLHIAQPALSAQIRSLETQLGCELFSRTTRKVDLTAAGELLLADAREIVERADRAAAKVTAAARGDRGALRVAFAAHGAGETSNEIFRRFAEEHPGIDVELVESATLEGLQQLVADHEADAAFAWLPVLHHELESEIVFSERKAVAMHPEHLLAAQDEVRPEDLESEPIVSSWEHYSPATTAYWLAPPPGANRDRPARDERRRLPVARRARRRRVRRARVGAALLRAAERRLPAADPRRAGERRTRLAPGDAERRGRTVRRGRAAGDRRESRLRSARDRSRADRYFTSRSPAATVAADRAHAPGG
jgi:DNA-binding transcriptional LysR family regulator